MKHRLVFAVITILLLISTGIFAQQGEQCPFIVGTRMLVNEVMVHNNVGSHARVPARTPNATEPATRVGRTLGLYLELALRVGEEPEALKSFRWLNSTADAARSGSSRSDGVQTQTHLLTIHPQKAVSRLSDRPSQRCSRPRRRVEVEARSVGWTQP